MGELGRRGKQLRHRAAEDEEQTEGAMAHGGDLAHRGVEAPDELPEVEVVAQTCKYEQLSHVTLVAFRDAAIAEIRVFQHWAVDCSEEFSAALSEWKGHENPRKLFKD
ncbi:hypothetical protein R1sor_005060 [Riccia sorocarpa]|uniref:Uncharacterized protein n=1 Tax=Riccia sorocarpa TaxID=122646 RepID=A0ABD3HM08_9MARC